MATAFQPRTRPARLGAAHGNRPLQVPKEFHQTTTHAVGSTTTVSTTATSSVSLFLTNLRLLDLDLIATWPGISLDTFAATGAAGAQGQKKRIQCVEWALFHLFALWDPEETANKLKPFFPPLDQVQSLNLRAALLRCLEQAKKNGALGRDAILRKTMLDDCKGERLEDLLAAFSSAVLKKVVSQEAASSGEHPALALSIALENRGYTGDKTELSCLVLAHKASLQRAKRHREVNAAKFRDFADLLGVKERTLVRKKEEARLRAEKGSSKTVSGEARLEMWRTLRNNWSGNERWMETLLYGDASIKKDGPFGMPFDRVWRRVQQSRLAEVESKDSGLLEQLEGRVNAHKERLEKWQRYRNTMFPQGHANASPSKRPAPTAKPKKGVDLGFGQHETLVLGETSSRKGQPGLGNRMTAEYRDMLGGLKKELANADQTQPKALLFLQHRRRYGKRISGTSEEMSEISSLEEDSLEMSPVEETDPSPPFPDKPDRPKRLVRPNLARPDLGSFNYSNGAANSEANSVTSPDNTEDGFSHRSSNPSTPRARSISRQSPNRAHMTNTKDPIITESPTQELADQILESMNNASPSPKKRPKARHTLSLAERTRLSMAPRGTSLFLQDEEDHEDDDPTITVSVPLNDTTEIDPNAEVEDDLISRTRKSMAGFEKARQKAQLERRRSQRKSRALPPPRESSFPKLEEEGDDQGMLAEELIGEEDMEAVFRSRPKIQASPLPSPTKELDEWDDQYG